MRNKYLEGYLNVVPESQRNRLLEVIRKQHKEAGVEPTEKELEQALADLISRLETSLGKPITKFKEASPYLPISSKDYNSTMEGAFVDLGAIYKQNNAINQTITKHQLLNKSVLRDIRSSLQKITDEAQINTIIQENRVGITDAKFNTFRKDDNESESVFYKAYVDTETNSLKLPLSLDQSALLLKERPVAQIHLNYLGGGLRGTPEQEKYSKKRAIDNSPNTFWGEVILTDEPISQNYDGTLYFGAICEVEIDLFRAELINNIQFNPFTQYPLGIIKIYYRESSAEAWKDLSVSSVYDTFNMEFNFEEVRASQIKIVLNQREANINEYKLPKIFINNVELWQQVVDGELSLANYGAPSEQISQDMLDQMTGWKVYLDALVKYKKRLLKSQGGLAETTLEDIFDSVTNTITDQQKKGADELKLQIFKKETTPKEDLISIKKYEYVYGAYDIEINRRVYAHKGEYLSPRFIPTGPVMLASVESTETIPEKCSTEYSLSVDGKNWLAVLPEDVTDITEFLDVDINTKKGYLRFSSAGISGVYRNSLILSSGNYSIVDSSGFLPDSSGYSGQSQGILLDNSVYSAQSTYTVKYSPVTGSNLIDLTKNPLLSSTEEIRVGDGDRQYSVELESYPFVDFDKINGWADEGDGVWASGVVSYEPIQATVGGYQAINRSNYYEEYNPALTSYEPNTYPYYEFIQAGKKLWFNTDISNEKVRVNYSYLNNYIQLKLLLRNNYPGALSVTPVVEDFTIKLRTLY